MFWCHTLKIVRPIGAADQIGTCCLAYTTVVPACTNVTAVTASSLSIDSLQKDEHHQEEKESVINHVSKEM